MGVNQAWNGAFCFPAHHCRSAAPAHFPPVALLTFLLPLLSRRSSAAHASRAWPCEVTTPGSLVSGATCPVSCVAARSWFCSLTESIHLSWLLPGENQRHCPALRWPAALNNVLKKQAREGRASQKNRTRNLPVLQGDCRPGPASLGQICFTL